MADKAWLDPYNEDQYLWLHETEWLAPVDILRYQPMEFHKPGFVPFAHNGGGDHWSWWGKGKCGVCIRS